MSEQLIQTPCIFGETGNLLLERELGRGGMGGVYMGRDKMLDRPVAVKVMLKEYGSDQQFVEKFKREAQSAARLIHPNIAQVYSYGISDGMPYIAMELVAGGSLYTLMSNSGQTDVPRVMKICEQVAQALRCASDQGVVHGDIKPENILLDANGNAKLVDFGLAAMQKDTSEIWGTPYYIAPEKVNKEIPDFRADMYSLGGTLYHALTGVAPFEGADADEVVRKRFETVCKKPSQLRSDLTPQIDALVMKMLEFDKAKRFPSFEALLAEFKNVMATGLQAGAAPTTDTLESASSSSSGKPKLKLKSTKKRFKVTSSSSSDEGEEEAKSSSRKKKRRYEEPAEEEDESSGKLGKVLFAVIGGIIAVSAFLAWYVHHDKKVREAELRVQLETGFEEVRKVLSTTEKMADECQKNADAFAEKTMNECQRITDEFGKLFSAEIASMLKPPPSKELLDAMESVKEQTEGEASTNDAPNKVEAPQTTAQQAPTAPQPKRSSFRPPQGDELDANSPEGQDYLKQKKEWEAKQGAAQQSDAPAGEAGQAGEAEQAQAPELKMPQEAKVIVDLWNRAYSCKACAIILHHRIDKLIEKIHNANFPGQDEATLDKYSDFSREIVSEYDAIKSSEEYSKLQKSESYIKDRGGRTITETVKRLRTERLEEERRLKKIKEAEDEKKRLEEMAQRKAEKIKEETAAIKDKFEALATAGVFRQLDWKGAKRQLNALKGDFETAEGAVAADLVIRKVAAMELVQEILKRNLKDFKFERGKALRGMKVIEVDDREMRILKKDGKSTMKMNWPKFYRECHGNLNELFNTFIVRGRRNGTPKLRPKDWSEAMMGAALTMRIICSDDPAASVRGEQIAKEAVRQFEVYRSLATEFFPDIDFSDVKPEE